MIDFDVITGPAPAKPQEAPAAQPSLPALQHPGMAPAPPRAKEPSDTPFKTPPGAI
jgi:hypothetical protein